MAKDILGFGAEKAITLWQCLALAFIWTGCFERNEKNFDDRVRRRWILSRIESDI